MLKSMAFALVIAVTAAAYEVTFEKHFATEELNKASPYYDLSPWGYYGGQLPKAYDITSHNYTYSPEMSFQEFNDIIAGKQNFSSTNEISEDSGFEKRYTSSQMSFSLVGDGGRDSYVVNTDKTCRSGDYLPWYYILVYFVDDGYITFWKSTVCNGKKESFNPTCDETSTAGQRCNFDFEPNSFRAYSGCHDSYSSDCSST
ncbi:hypothetical protein N7495_009712 [Penicillium taxi]|uniref:uncharacterized protein n=1 Tax=Penicillium taxi TaxID=168475 RepID=UPI0025452AF0|nr:uncharacterized protein N7495_009712 [Penicillium taxi]KAJ5885202.1 hypothetical protein N7495_009712 [Penicillium taxi]